MVVRHRRLVASSAYRGGKRSIEPPEDAEVHDDDRVGGPIAARPGPNEGLGELQDENHAETWLVDRLPRTS